MEVHLQIVVSNKTAKPRKVNWDGRDYYVAPMTMIVPGILHGSSGALLYPPDEVRRTVQAWNSMPVVVNHPMVNGQPVSARDPAILEGQKIGEIFNARYDGDKLVADAYIDIEKTLRVDPRIINALKRNRPIELSTGLAVDLDFSAGDFNGITYNAIARNYRPDHLAILPDSIGACSLQDGCGVLVNEANSVIVSVMNEDGSVGDTDVRTPLDPLAMVANLSFGDIRSALGTALQSEDRFTGDTWIEEVFPDEFVYAQNGKLYRLPYSIKDNMVTIDGGLPQEVQLFKSYVPVSPMGTNHVTNSEDESMDREKIIADLIANCSCWEEGDRALLTNMSDAQLKKTHEHSIKVRQNEAVANAARQGFEHGDVGFVFNEKTGKFDPKPKEKAPETPVANETSKPKTLVDWLKEAPPEVQSVVRNSINWENSQKQACIEKITANDKNTLTPEQLAAMPLETLQGIASLAEETPVASPFPTFLGAAAPTTNKGKKNEPAEEALLPPVINWAGDKD